ncbi:MAG: MBL fold metallo-hydrolase [Planctomycetota bacterium]|jgi:phosphoribosyl 1,2-cyclic phosphodiesterase
MSSSLYFKSLCSSSSGNCLALWTDHTRVLIDCGLGSMKRARQMLRKHLGDPLDIDAAIVSHMHGDHIGYYPLRVLEDHGIKVRVHEKCLAQLKQKHFNGYGFSSLRLKPFSDRHFRVGDLTFRPFELPHNPFYPTFGFTVKYKTIKVVFATDFNSWDDSLGYFVDANFIFVESNHDLELLRRHFNPNSQFHLPNPQTGKLLYRARKNSRRAPQAVMLGHLSLIRNEPDIAVEETKQTFEGEQTDLDFRLLAAPGLEASQTVKVSI